MYVMRSKVTLAPADDFAVAALLGQGDDALARNDVPASTKPNRLVRRGDLCFIRVAEEYWLALGPASGLARVAAALDATTEAAAALAEIRLGIPAITPPIVERFVAQMLNLDELRALSFDKGCYPGQEIIARVHNLGGVKRRARRYGMRAAVPAPASPIHSAEQAVGEVVRAAPTEAGCELLAVVDHAAAGAALTCGGTQLVELPLPFAVPSD
jgi:folate-binding protein YgfZ